MIKELIYNPIDPIPQEYADKLVRLSYEPDWSLTCLGIALLKPRIPDYNGITGVYQHYENKSDCLDAFKFYHDMINESPRLCYYTYTNGEADAAEQYKDFKEKKSIGALIKEKTGNECQVLYHETKNCAAIFVNSRDIRVYHLLMSFISLYFPSIFAANPMQPEDFELIKTLTKKEKQPFIAAIQKAVQPYVLEFRRLQLVSMMNGIHDKNIEKARRELERSRQRMMDAFTNYKDCLEAVKEKSVIYEGMKATEKYDDVESDLCEYLATNKAIHNLTMNNNELSFTVATTLINYNADAYETFRARGAIFNGDYTYREYGARELLPVFRTRENRVKLMDHIFKEDADLAVRIAGNYILNIENNYMTTSKTYNYAQADPLFEDYIPNPHLRQFGCLGGYETRVTEALQDRNYIGAIEMAIASAGSVDLDETEQTFRPFLGYLMSSTKKVLVTKDGTEMTPEEALLWIIDKEKTDETN